MTDQTNGSFWVVTEMEEPGSEQRVERGLGKSLFGGGKAKQLDPEDLKKNMSNFLSNLEDILDAGKTRIGEFQIDEITVSAQISGDGKVCLLGSGVKVGMQGGLKFVLKRHATE